MPPKYFIFPNPSTLQPDYKWTNNYIAGAGGVQTLIADIGGVDFTQNTAAAQPQDGGGKLDFDGADDFMEAPLTDTDVLDNVGISGEMSMMVRVDTTANGGFHFIMGSREGGNPERMYFLRNNSAGPNVWTHGMFDVFPEATVVSGSATLATVINNGSADAYIDGVLVSSHTITQTSGSGNNFKLGTAGAATIRFDGSIYEVRIYTKALNATQVLNAYNEMNP